MLRRLQAGPGVWWAWACVAIYGGVLSFIGREELPWTIQAGMVLATLYPVLLLAGALRFADRKVPAWLVPGGLGVGLIRGATPLLDASWVGHGIALAVEPTLCVLAGVVVTRLRTQGPRAWSERLLPVTLVAMGGFEALLSLGMLMGTLSIPLIAGHLTMAPLLLAVQLSACAHVNRRRLEDNLELLEQRIAEQTERYRTVSELSSDYSFGYVLSRDGRVHLEWITDAVNKVTGYEPEEFEELGWLAVVHPDDRDAIVRDMELAFAPSSELETLDTRIITKQGDVRWLNIRFRSAGLSADGTARIVGAAQDVTDRMRMEEEKRRLDRHVREGQRLESLGRLAGGVAHDFNNVLTVILGNAKLALEESGVGPGLQERLRRIQFAGEYAAGLTDQILTYSGKAAVDLEPVDLSRLVVEMLDLLQASVSERVTLETHLPEGLPAVEGDVTQLRQLLLNLVTNAAESLGERGGRVCVRTGARGVDEVDLRDARGVADAEPGHYVFLEVSDTGCGLPEEIRAQIFDPFFTTKATGRGMGLAAALGIVRGHRGLVRIESELGVGSRFEVLLPCSARRAAAAQGPTARPRRAGRGHVLVVDDDPAVLELAGEFLERGGFQVRTACSGREALDQLEDPGFEVDAVVLDLVMPGLSGEEAFLAIRALRPGLPVVLASGYDRERAAERFSARGIADFVRKPYELEDLVDSVNAALAQR